MHTVKLFVDTNILIDVIAKRDPFYHEAAALFTLAENGKVSLFTTATSVATVWYILKKYGKRGEVRDNLITLLSFIKILPVSELAVKRAVESDFADFEDALQHFAALEMANIDYIITRNVTDFKRSLIPVCSAGDFLADYKVE